MTTHEQRHAMAATLPQGDCDCNSCLDSLIAEADRPEYMTETELWCDPTKATCYLATGHNGDMDTATSNRRNHMTKYAEWVTQPCGRCRLNIDIGSIIDDDIDPDCPDHRQFRCTVCGEMTDAATIAHGTLGLGGTHTPQEGTT